MPWLIGKAEHEPYFTNDPPKSGDQMLDPPKIAEAGGGSKIWEILLM